MTGQSRFPAGQPLVTGAPPAGSELQDTSSGNEPTALNRLVPAYQFQSLFCRHIKAKTERAWDALLSVTTEELPICRLLMRVRSGGHVGLRGPLLEAIPTPTLARIEGREIIKGKIAKFWKPRPEPAPLSPGDPVAFRDFAEPGWAKAAVSLRVTPHEGGSAVTIETRVQATDGAARRAFTLYWPILRLGGAGLIRVESLRAVARRAERSAV